jgi:hypothetical protein
MDYRYEIRLIHSTIKENMFEEILDIKVSLYFSIKVSLLGHIDFEQGF